MTETLNLNTGGVPQLTDELIAKATSIQFHRFPNTNTTVCAIAFASGFAIVGQSSCALDSMFDEAVGEELARENARDNLMPIVAFNFMESIHDGE